MDNGILRLMVFVVLSCGLAYVSRRPLRSVRSHGFYRFFAWECILGLVLVNLPAWFSDPISILQILSWLLFIISLLFLGEGVYFIRTQGGQDSGRGDDSLLPFEKTSTLVAAGIYRYIRHPLYGSLLFFAWGTFLKDLNLYSVSLVIPASLLLVATAKADEVECRRYFGPSYGEYMSRTKMFIPFVI